MAVMLNNKIMTLIEISIVAIVILAIILVSGFFIIRALNKQFYSISKSHARFDIELRKAFNLVEKNIEFDGFEPFRGKVVKNMLFEEKKALIEVITLAMKSIEENENNKYIFEIYEKLMDERRIYDIKVLEYNKFLSMFPFSMYARVLNHKEMETYYKKVDEYDQMVD